MAGYSTIEHVRFMEKIKKKNKEYCKFRYKIYLSKDDEVIKSFKANKLILWFLKVYEYKVGKPYEEGTEINLTIENINAVRKILRQGIPDLVIKDLNIENNDYDFFINNLVYIRDIWENYGAYTLSMRKI